MGLFLSDGQFEGRVGPYVRKEPHMLGWGEHFSFSAFMSSYDEFLR